MIAPFQSLNVYNESVSPAALPSRERMADHPAIVVDDIHQRSESIPRFQVGVGHPADRIDRTQRLDPSREARLGGFHVEGGAGQPFFGPPCLKADPELLM